MLHCDANLPAGDKDRLASKFAALYAKDEKGFLSFIGGCDIAPCKQYKESWEYIKTGTNSLQRCTNFNIFLSDEAKNIKQRYRQS
ncbi:MAG: hypothetical protein RR015_05505 [Bacteroidales bacterium]